MRELKKQYSDINSRMPRHSTAHLCNPAGGYISWEIDSTTDTSLFLTTYRGGSHLPADIYIVDKERWICYARYTRG